MRTIWKYIVVFVGLIALYLLFALASGMVSDRAVERHVKRTIDKTDLNADSWSSILHKPNYYMDNFTDALIVNQVLCQTDDYDNIIGPHPNTRWNKIMLVPRLHAVDEQCGNLHRMVDGDTGMKAIYYARYWHGSTFLMRILLAVKDYVVLRTFFYLLSSLLLLWVVLALAKRVGVWVAVIYGVSLALVDVFMMQFSIQFLPVLIISLTGTLWVLSRGEGSLGIPFFVLGSLTTYFDLLTAPLMTWGIPLLVAIVAGRMSDWKSRLSSATWFVGYGATWVSKWVIATLTTPINVFSDASRQASFRSAVEDYTRWDAAERNLDLVPWLYVVIAIVVLAVLACRHFNGNGWRNALFCLAVALAPLAWYMAIANHSYLHFWFTYRSLSMTVMGLMLAVGTLVDWQKVGLLKRRLTQ